MKQVKKKENLAEYVESEKIKYSVMNNRVVVTIGLVKIQKPNVGMVTTVNIV